MEEEISLRELIEVLLRGRRIIFGICVLAVLAAGLISFFVLPVKYEAKATIMFDKKFTDQQGLSLASYDDMIKSPDRIEKVFNHLQLDKRYTLKTLEKAINTQVDEKANQIEITVSWTDAGQAQEIANDLGQGSVSDFKERLIADKERQIVNYDEMLKDIEKDMESTPKLLGTSEVKGLGQVVQIPQVNPMYEKLSARWDDLNYAISQLKAEKEYLEEGIQAGGKGLYIMLQQAPVPVDPVSPRKMLNIAVAGVLGVMISVFVVFFMEFWRKTGQESAQ